MHGPPASTTTLWCVTVTMQVFFVVYNGDSGLGLNNTELKVAFIYAYGIGGVVGLITIPTIIPFLRRKVKDNYHDDGTVKRVRYQVIGCPRVLPRKDTLVL